jgi:predicted MFS family arabinose efflux permease
VTTRPDLAVPAGSPAGGDRRRRARTVVAALAVTQTVGYGALYYAFAVLLVPMARDLNASTTAVTGALTASVLAGAAAAIPAGRWLDRHGGRALMTGGSVAGTVLLLLASRVESLPALYLAWVGIGLVAAAVLYETAFAVVVSWHPEPRRRANALLAVTVVAGFASSIFFPLTGALVEAHGWRTALVVLATLHGAVTVPLHLLVRRPAGSRPPSRARSTAAVAGAIRDRGYWLLVAVFVAHGAALAAIAVHLVAYLIDLGHPPAFAATIAGGIGVLSVTGRLVSTGAQRRWATRGVVAVVFAVQAAGALALPLIGASTAGAVAAVLLFGLGFGVATIARPALLADRYGTAGFATISGLLAVPLTITKALAPLGAAALYQLTGGYTAVALACAAACALAAAGLAGSGTRAG